MSKLKCINLSQFASPRVHLQPGLQLSGFGSIYSCQDVPTVYMDDLHWQVAHLTCLIQRLQGRWRRRGTKKGQVLTGVVAKFHSRDIQLGIIRKYKYAPIVVLGHLVH